LDSTVTCPICGLRLAAVADDRGVIIQYAIEEWHRRCSSAELDTPSLCPNFLQSFYTLLSPYVSPPAVHLLSTLRIEQDSCFGRHVAVEAK
jgi:hypothetical protein